MEKVPKKHKKAKHVSREELLALTKEELADRIIQLECHNTNLRNIISKSIADNTKSSKNEKHKDYNFSNSNFRPVLLHIIYFGWDYHGFVTQEDTAHTIEQYLFDALTRTCLIESRETSQYHRCGRTDKGVSAFGQVISIKLRSKFIKEKQNETQSLRDEMPYCKMLNRLLPKDIRAVGWIPIPEDNPDFSARFDCKSRHYKYYFPRGSLDITSMREASKLLIGNHDFRNLCKMDVGNGVTEFRRTVRNADVVPVDSNDVDKPTSMYYFLIEGNAFLWHQIRCTMAVLFLIGSGKESLDIIAELLDVETNQKKPQYHMAIDLPLNLFHCSYELDGWIYDFEELDKVIKDLNGEWCVQNIKSTMLKDCIQDLQNKYDEARKKQTEDADTTCERNEAIGFTECLTQGVKARVYTPLLKRQTCSSLEERIQHYKRRRKLPESDVNEKVD